MRWEKVELNRRLREEKSPGRKGGIFGPGKRWGHTCNSIKGGRFLYVFGGYGKDNCQTNDVHVYDTMKQTWSKPMVKGVPPSPRDSHSCTTVGNNLFVFGGTDGKNPLKDLHILDTSSNTWMLPSLSSEGPDAREGHSAALVDKRLFIFGGCGKSHDDPEEVYFNDLYILDTESLVWKRAVTSGTPPSARDSHTCSSWKNKIIVLGGEDATDYYLSDVHVLDADTGIWNKVTNAGPGPSARFSVAGDCLDPRNGVLVFIGGCNDNLEALDDMYYLFTGISMENGQDEQRPEKFSIRKELKKKRQEQYLPMNRCENDKDGSKLTMMSDSYPPVPLPSYGAAGKQNSPLYELKPAEGKIFEAKVTDAFHYGYTIETNIDGKPLRGILFSFKPSVGHAAPAYPSRKRMGVEGGSVELKDGCDLKLKVARTIDEAQKESDHTQTDEIRGRESTSQESPMETLASDSTNSTPVNVCQPQMAPENSLPSPTPPDSKDDDLHMLNSEGGPSENPSTPKQDDTAPVMKQHSGSSPVVAVSST
ncbi:galactose oxidase/kelch repeat superfamily protein isoform X2 [Tasmannia lanceolata]|uniref:galactose oxidase/kelch repeat superfamily protein isoform X2 n=1 Tax=Tasmannia lanceolata TaxID=3420 RepID=UPI004063A9B7